MTTPSESDLLIAKTLEKYNFNPESMIGPAAKVDRQLIISEIQGYAQALSQSGITNMLEALTRHCFVEGQLSEANVTCAAVKYKMMGQWAQQIVQDHENPGHFSTAEELNG